MGRFYSNILYNPKRTFIVFDIFGMCKKDPRIYSSFSGIPDDFSIYDEI